MEYFETPVLVTLGPYIAHPKIRSENIALIPEKNATLTDVDTEGGDTIEIRSALLAASFDLLNDEITGPQWMGHLANLASCESADCIWWRAGQPDEALKDTHGAERLLPNDLTRQLDNLITELAPESPGYIDELARQAGIPLDESLKNYLTPDKLVVCIDWEPARVFFIFSDRRESPEWQAADRDKLTEVLPTIRKSLAIKKRLSRKEDFLELSRKVADAYTQGVATLTPDRDVITFNSVAKAILDDSKYISISDNKLELQDKTQQSEFTAQLAQLNQITADELPTFSWHCNLGYQRDASQLLMTMKVTRMPNWRMESSSDSRVIVITLDRLDQPSALDEKQLRDYYGLSKAQARFARALLVSESTEAAADICNISKNTARTHLRAIYEKVGVNKLSRLMLQLGINSTGLKET